MLPKNSQSKPVALQSKKRAKCDEANRTDCVTSKKKIAKGNDCSTERQHKEKRMRQKLKRQRKLGRQKRGKEHVISVQIVKSMV